MSELAVLLIIAALLIFAPRKGDRVLDRRLVRRSFSGGRSPKGEGGPSKFAIALAALFLLWFLVAMECGTLWNRVFGTIAQP